jgi:hypothetical protein
LEDNVSINETKPAGFAAPAKVSAKSKQLDSVTWAIFFIWIGVAVLARIGWTWTLFGIGAVILGGQAALWRQGEKLDGFWILCGVAFLLGAIWDLLGMTWPLAPVLLILLGLGTLWSAVFGAKED